MRRRAQRHLTIELTPEIRVALEQLYMTGYFGFSVEAVAEEALRQYVREQVKRGWLDPAPRKRGRRGR